MPSHRRDETWVLSRDGNCSKLMGLSEDFHCPVPWWGCPHRAELRPLLPRRPGAYCCMGYDVPTPVTQPGTGQCLAGAASGSADHSQWSLKGVGSWLAQHSKVQARLQDPGQAGHHLPPIPRDSEVVGTHPSQSREGFIKLPRGRNRLNHVARTEQESPVLALMITFH